jgi:octaprenyl-diphosphate synthase
LTAFELAPKLQIVLKLAIEASGPSFEAVGTPAMTPAAAVATLRETATLDRVGERAARRLADAHAVFGPDMEWVHGELAKLTRTGVAPATEAAAHLLGAGGKRVRPLALLLASACFGAIPHAARELAVVAELVHLATLLHDDVVDDGQERRGMTTSRRIWGNAVSVLAGDLLLTHALEKTSAVAPGEILAELFRTLRQLVDGEVVQLRGRTRLDVDEATYFQIVRDKTASLFVWAARTGARVNGAPPSSVNALGAFGGHLGMAFQLVDDALDYAGDRLVTGKNVYADLNEGKLTLPLILTLARMPHLSPELSRVREGDEDAAVRIVSAVHEAGACDEVRTRAREETRLAIASLDAVPPSPARDLLAAVASDLGSRLA